MSPPHSDTPSSSAPGKIVTPHEAYTAERLDEQLQQNTLAFFADPTRCSFDVERHELRLSPILN